MTSSAAAPLEPTRVSVIIPCRNRSALLSESLQSVLEQSALPSEIIVVDDGSEVPLEAAVDVRNTNDVPVRFIRNEVSLGANASRNIGAESSTSALIAFQDSDDLWLPNKLEFQIRSWVAQGSPLDALIYCMIERRLADGSSFTFPKSALDVETLTNRSLLRGNFISTQTVLTPREHFLKYRFDQSLSRLQDWELWLRMAPDSTLIGVPQPLAISRETADSISTDRDAYRRSIGSLVKKHIAFFSTDPDAMAHFARAACAASLATGEYAKAFEWMVRMVTADLRGSQQLLKLRVPRIAENMGL